MPFYLCNALGTFQRIMESVLAGLQWHECFIYLDDIVVFAATFEEHIKRLEAVFIRLASAGLQLKPAKCHFARTSVKYLGHIVSSHGLATDPDKVPAVSEFPPPSLLNQLRSFLGLAGYYRRFIPGFSRTSAPWINFEMDSRCPECLRRFENLPYFCPLVGFPQVRRRLLGSDRCL